MSLKIRKYMTGLLCLCAALSISLGFTFCEESSDENEAVYETAAYGYGVDETETVYETVANEYNIDETEAAYAAAYQASPVSESETEIYAGQSDSGRQKAVLGYLGRILVLAGAVCALWFVFGTKQGILIHAAEMAMAAVCFAVVLFYKLAFPALFVRFILRVLLVIMALVCLRSLKVWITGRLPLPWTAAYRLGILAAGKEKRQSRYLFFQFLWSLFLLLMAAFSFFMVCFGSEWWIFGAVCSGSVILSACCMYRGVKDLDHLTEQIHQVYQGKSGAVCHGVFEDCETQLTELFKQRDEAVQKAVTSERFRVDLISNVSHDLRTPLTAILGYGELLEKEKLSPEGTVQLKRLNEKAGYMRELVESLFELTKVSSGAERCKMDKIDIIRLLEQTLGLFDDQLGHAGVRVRRHYDADSVMVVTDGNRMHQVFANLIGNAVKYTLPGTRIHLAVRATGGECSIRITNIASYEMDFEPEEIVQRFARGDQARSTKGSGLGLAIAQTYTESVGGQFHVEIDGEQFSAVVQLFC